MSDGGKGSGRRPTLVDSEQFTKNWEAIFGKKDNAENHDCKNNCPDCICNNSVQEKQAA